MHEFSLMREVLSMLHRSAAEEGISRIESVCMKVGVMSCAFAPALETAFEVLSGGDPLLEGARLQVLEQGVVVRCRQCWWEGETEPYELLCGQCGGGEVHVIRGEALTVDSYEGRKCPDGHRQTDGERDEGQ